MRQGGDGIYHRGNWSFIVLGVTENTYCCRNIGFPVHQCRTKIRRQGIWRKREMALFFCQAEGKTQQASASRTVLPQPLEIREDFICGSRSPGYMIRIKVVKVFRTSFPLHYFKTVIAGVRPPGNCIHLPLVYRCNSRRVGGDRCQM